jgi:hypothetical protein
MDVVDGGVAFLGVGTWDMQIYEKTGVPRNRLVSDVGSDPFGRLTIAGPASNGGRRGG